MDEFEYLVHTIERLLAPDGCPWDREQTLQSMRSSLVEETYEVIEAIDLNQDQDIEEELGDLLFNVIFLCKLAEKERRFTLQQTIRSIAEKLVGRHPHVFKKSETISVERVFEQWEEIKQAEKESRVSILDGIPKNLPALMRAQKMIKKLDSQQFAPHPIEIQTPEDKAADMLWKMIQDCSAKGIQVEEALRRRLTQEEAEFRKWEKERN